MDLSNSELLLWFDRWGDWPAGELRRVQRLLIRRAEDVAGDKPKFDTPRSGAVGGQSQAARETKEAGANEEVSAEVQGGGMSDRIQGTIDPKNQHDVQRFLSAFYALVGKAKGLIRVDICRHVQRRTDRQNRYMWPCFCEPFAAWLTEQYGRRVYADEAHQIFKDTFLRVPEANADGEQMFLPNGDPMMRTRSTTDLTTVEFNEYLDQCGELLWDLCKFRVPEPSVYHERDERRKTA